MKSLQLPLSAAAVAGLCAGDEVLLSGIVYTARDRVHKIVAAELERAAREKRPPVLPFPLAGQTVYYAGPTPAPPGRVIGSVGPTTSRRMDVYTPALLAAGLRATIGKGQRAAAVAVACARFAAVHFTTYGGCGALLASHVAAAALQALPELGPEAVWRLEVVDFPAVVAIDGRGAVFPAP